MSLHEDHVAKRRKTTQVSTTPNNLRDDRKDDRKDDHRDPPASVIPTPDFVTFWAVGDHLCQDHCYSQSWFRGQEPDPTKWVKIGGEKYHGTRDGGFEGLHH